MELAQTVNFTADAFNGMVGRVTHNPILKGVRRRNNKISKRINKTGRSKQINAPPEEHLSTAGSAAACIAMAGTGKTTICFAAALTSIAAGTV
jgi:hypothetical protein